MSTRKNIRSEKGWKNIRENAKSVHIRLDPEEYDVLAGRAKGNLRSVSAQALLIIRESLSLARPDR